MRILLFNFALLLLFSCSSSQEGLPETYHDNGIALDGYDPVAYFVDQKAVKGSADYSCQYEGIVYHLSSSEHKQAFTENPTQYLPAYGGWCALAVAKKSTKMKPDPTQWKVQDGKLLLFYDNFLTSMQGGLLKAWNKDPQSNKVLADKNWSTMKQK